MSCAYLVYCVSRMLFRMRTSIARLVLNNLRLTQYIRHAATAPTQRNDVNY